MIVFSLGTVFGILTTVLITSANKWIIGRNRQTKERTRRFRVLVQEI